MTDGRGEERLVNPFLYKNRESGSHMEDMCVCVCVCVCEREDDTEMGLKDMRHEEWN
jgi:hypothetical protein